MINYWQTGIAMRTAINGCAVFATITAIDIAFTSSNTKAPMHIKRCCVVSNLNQGNPIHSTPPLEYDGVDDTRTAFHIFVEDGVRNLTYSMSRPPDSNTSTIPIAPSNTLIDWNLYEARQDDIELNIYDPQETVRAIAAELYARLDESPPSDDEDNAEWSDSDIEPDDVEEPTGDCKQSNY